MNLFALRALLVTIDAGSFAAAARATCVPKSTLANRVSELEAELGVRLLERTTRRLRLTADGALFVDHARRLVADADDLERLLRDRDTTPRGLLRVATPTLFGETFMGLLASRFLEAAPEAQIDVVFTDRVFDLLDENIECAIRVGLLEDSSLIAKTIARSHAVVVAAPSVASIHVAPVHPDDLGRWPLISAAPADRAQVWALEHASERWAAEPDARLRVGGMLAAREAALAGAGAAWLPEFLVAEALDAGRLIRLLPAWRSAATPINLVYPSRRHLSARVRAFANVLTAAFPERQLHTEPPLS